METKVAVIAIIVENAQSVEGINNLLHEFSDSIIGRMGVPYRAKNVNVISIAVDASQDVIDKLESQVGALDGVSAKTVYAPV